MNDNRSKTLRNQHSNPYKTETLIHILLQKRNLYVGIYLHKMYITHNVQVLH